VRQLPHPQSSDIRLDAVLFALSDPQRRLMVELLAREGDSLSGLCVAAAGAAPSAGSHHLRVLRESGVTSTQVAGNTRIVSLRRADLDARFPGLLDSIVAASLTEGDNDGRLTAETLLGLTPAPAAG
jgi:DNA-binding transcriptional ArsR family regulator